MSLSYCLKLLFIYQATELMFFQILRRLNNLRILYGEVSISSRFLTIASRTKHKLHTNLCFQIVTENN